MTTTHPEHRLTPRRALQLGLAALAVVLLWLHPAGAAWAQEEADGAPGAIELVEPAEPAAASSDVPVDAGDGTARPKTRFQADDRVSFSDVANDLYLAGQSVEVSGHVLDNAFLAGQNVDLRQAAIDGDLMVAAENVTVGGRIGGDIYAFAARLSLLEGSEVAGDVWCGGEAIELAGTVGGTVECGAGRASLDGIFGGDVSLDVGALSVGPDAQFQSSLEYKAPQAGQIDDGAFLAGGVSFTESMHDQDHAQDHQDGSALGWLLVHSWSLVGAFIVGCVLLAMGRSGVRRIAQTMREQPGASMGLGLVALMLIPATSLVAIVLIFTLQLGVMTLLLYGISLYLATILAGYALGDLLLARTLSGADPSPYAALAIGLLALHGLMAIPYLGVLVHLVAMTAGLGAVWVAARNSGVASKALS